jgi:hypothetical protein
MVVFPYWESRRTRSLLDDDSAPLLARGGEAAGDDKRTGEVGGEREQV